MNQPPDGTPSQREKIPESIRGIFQLAVEENLFSEVDAINILEACQQSDQELSPASFIREAIARNKVTRFQAKLLLSQPPQALSLGTYVLIDKIGQGGMGSVYKAKHKTMGRIVAVKVLSRKGRLSQDSIRRFQREVKTAAKLNHPNIVTAFDAGEQNGLHYLVMEFISGQDLKSYIDQHGPLPYQVAINYLLQAARGFQFAHEKQIIHRDIKPANLLLDEDGAVKILDMGLARIIQDESSDDMSLHQLTADGAMMGTIDYLSPEQGLDTKNADQRSDIYSLGCTLFTFLTGKTVFPAGTLVQKILAHREVEAPSLLQFCPDIPTALDQLFQRMVAKRPSERPQSMAEVIAVLQAIAAGETISDRFAFGNADTAEQEAILETLISGATETNIQAQSLDSGINKTLAGLGAIASQQNFAQPQPLVGRLPYPLVSPQKGTANSRTLKRKRKTATWMVGGGVLALLVLLGGLAWIMFPTLKQDSKTTAVLAENQLTKTEPPSNNSQPRPSNTQKSEQNRSVPSATTSPDLSVAAMKTEDIAKWVLEGGGKVGLKGRTDWIETLAGLPSANNLSIERIYWWTDNEFVKRLTPGDIDKFYLLPDLTWLEIRGQPIGDEGCALLAKFKKLKHLNVHATGLTDRGLKELSNLSGLEFLDVGFNDGTITDQGTTYLINLKSLKTLVLHSPSITDQTLLNVLAKLPQLASLEIAASRVTDEAIRNFKAQKPDCLLGHIGRPVATGDTPNIPAPTRTSDRIAAEWAQQAQAQIEIATKSGKRVISAQEPLPTVEFQLTAIRRPKLVDWNREQLVALQGLNSLKTLDFFECRPTPTALRNLAKVTCLQELELQRCGITDETLALLAPLTELTYLGLADDVISDKAFDTIKGFKRLEVLNLDNNGRLQGSRLKDLAECSNLKKLSLLGTVFSPGWVEQLAFLPKLTNLSLLGTNTRDEDLQRLLANHALEEIQIGHTPVTDDVVDLLLAEPTLKIVSVGGEYTALSQKAVQRLQKEFAARGGVFYAAKATPDRLISAIKEGNWKKLDLARREFPVSNSIVRSRLVNSSTVPGLVSNVGYGNYSSKVLNLGKYDWCSFKNPQGTNVVIRIRFRILRENTAPPTELRQACIRLRDSDQGAVTFNIADRGDACFGEFVWNRPEVYKGTSLFRLEGKGQVNDPITATLAVYDDTAYAWVGGRFIQFKPNLEVGPGTIGLGWLDGFSMMQVEQLEYQVLDE